MRRSGSGSSGGRRPADPCPPPPCAILGGPGTYPRPVCSQRSRCESGAVPQLRCPQLRGDEPGRLGHADELSPRRKGGSRGTAAEPPPSASRGGFLWSHAGISARSPWQRSSSSPPPQPRGTQHRRRGSSRSPPPRPRICSRSARASRWWRSTISPTTRRSAPHTKLSGYTPNAEAVAGYKPDLVVVSFDANHIVEALGKLEDPGARPADRGDARPGLRAARAARRRRPGTPPAPRRSSPG